MERASAHRPVFQAGHASNLKIDDSLSQVAQAITGTKWNGSRYFGLRASPLMPDCSAVPDRKRRLWAPVPPTASTLARRFCGLDCATRPARRCRSSPCSSNSRQSC
ncbi:DUF2924 domain-containing protein [Methylobacterium sp. A54F]